MKKYLKITAVFFAVVIFFSAAFVFWKVKEKAEGGNSQDLPPENYSQNSADQNNMSGGLPNAREEKNPAANPAGQEPETEADNANAEETNLKIAILGDTQRFSAGNPEGGIQRAVENLKKINPNIILAVGDLLSSCDGGEKCGSGLDDWKKILGPFFPKTYEVMGNHDRTGGEKADQLWQNFFSLPQNGPAGYKELAYSFDIQNAHIVALNSEKPEEHAVGRDQRDWLEKDLAASRKDFIFVFFHEPAYPTGHKIGESLDAKAKDRDALWAILEKYKVTAVFNGHEHIHSRKKAGSIYQFILGNTDSYDHEAPKAGLAEYFYVGSHFGLLEISGKKAEMKIYADDGRLINSFSLVK